MAVPLQSDGVVALTRFEPGDADVLRRADEDPAHRRAFEAPEAFVPTLEHARAVIERWHEETRRGTRDSFAVRDAQTGELLGGCEKRPHGGGLAQIAYWTYPPHRGRGVAPRAVDLLAGVARQEGLRTLEAKVAPWNAASDRVVCKCGFEPRADDPRTGERVYRLELGSDGGS